MTELTFQKFFSARSYFAGFSLKKQHTHMPHLKVEHAVTRYLRKTMGVLVDTLACT